MACCEPFDGVKIFSATKARDREELGTHITAWIRKNRSFTVIDKMITQSSDSEFHCLTITIFYRDMGAEGQAR